jgi:prepilin-type N-terminal cleavage/methylation domain-containing protein
MSSKQDLPTAIRRRLALERGFTLIEILIAMALVAVGVAATIGVFGSSSRATVRAQRGEVAVQQAQAEIDRLSTLDYGETALTSAPTASTDPYDPRSRVQSGNRFQVRTGLIEDLVLTAASGMTPNVDPGPTTYSVGSGGAAVTGKVYRFVSWRDEQCPTLICDGSENTKRISVAVTLDPAHSNEPLRPRCGSRRSSPTRMPCRPDGRRRRTTRREGRSRARRASTSTTRAAV